MFLDLPGLELLWVSIISKIKEASEAAEINLESLKKRVSQNESNIETFKGALAEKASNTDITDLQNNKADASTVEDIQNTLASKANQSDLASKLDTAAFNTYAEKTAATLEEKANASSLTEVSEKVTILETNKQATINGGASTITNSNLAASRALISNSNGKVAVSDITATELSYLDGATSNIQNQITNLANTKASTSVATTGANGLMSSTDKSKLDGIAAGANKTTVDSSLSSSSTNPVQNKVINTALSGKQDTISGAASTITSSNLTANRALISNSNGKIAVSAVTSTELGYLGGVTSKIQTQLNAKAPAYQYSTTDLTAGSSTLAKGTLYFVYEE